MEKIKKTIIILIVVLIIIAIIIAILLNSQSTEEEKTNNVIQTEKVNTFSEVEDYTTYYTVKEIINNYINYMKQINGDQHIDTSKLNMTQEEIASAMQSNGMNAIKGILDAQYIQDLNVTEDKIKEEQIKYKQKGDYSQEVNYNLNIDDVSVISITSAIDIALVDARIDNKELNLLIKLDKTNNTFSIFLEDFIEKYNYTKEMSKEDINISTDNIEKNDYNGNIKINATDSYIISQYFSDYKMKMIYDTEEAYNLLDETYRERKYGRLDDFKNYIDNNKQTIEFANISKYQMSEVGDTTQYVCIDTNGKYYIFMVDSPAKYKVALDTYTIDLPEFIEKYEDNSNVIKAGLNIQKVFDAVNDKDYKYFYNKLDSTFRQNNFPTEESFKDYVEKNFSNNQLVYDNGKESGDLYIYDVTVSEGTENNKQAVKKTFIVKLLEGTDFVMSFNVQD